ncbi:hypothetical protein BHV42_00345 [Candidatus Melainabacteria bacterium MEL.A1]|nr:hypothetical protein BHV42_00345 [Candidatus Melainabacteria bacterium MEL.A1]
MKILKLFIIFSLALLLTGCRSKNNDTAHNKRIVLTEAQEKNAKIQTSPLSGMDIELQITIPAQFKARNQSIERIYSPIDGKITNVFVEPGAILKVGQPIVQIKSDAISQIQLEFLEKILDIDANINELRAQYNLSLQNYNRERTLYNEKISSRADYETANAQLRKDKANLDALNIKRSSLINVYRQRLAVYGGTIDNVIKTKQIYPYITIKATKNGVLLERKVNPGEIVEQNRELFNLADLKTIWLVGYAFEKDSPYLHLGEAVTGTIEESTETINGVLSYVSPILDNTTKTLEVRADIPNKNFKIKPNMYAEMYVNTGIAHVLAIPTDAVEKFGDYNFAYVKIAPHTYEERKVETGKKNDQYTEVLSGIKAGEKVVTRGSFELLGESIKKQEAE